MTDIATIRRPRFRRASTPPPFRITDGDLLILQTIAQYRFSRSTQIAALVGRSLDRTNDRLLRLYHAGYVDRPRAQLDYYPTSGSAPMVYGLAELGALLLKERRGFPVKAADLQLNNESAGRPFIEHQLEITEFWAALEESTRTQRDVCLIRKEELIEQFAEQTRGSRIPVSMRAHVCLRDKTVEFSVIPDLIFGLRYPDGSKRCFMVEIDRGTMPVSRSDISQSSFQRKMRGYFAAYAAKEHERRFGWKTFRVLTVACDQERLNSILRALKKLDTTGSPGADLFLFTTRDELLASNLLSHRWQMGSGEHGSLL